MKSYRYLTEKKALLTVLMASVYLCCSASETIIQICFNKLSHLSNRSGDTGWRSRDRNNPFNVLFVSFNFDLAARFFSDLHDFGAFSADERADLVALEQEPNGYTDGIVSQIILLTIVVGVAGVFHIFGLLN